MSSKSVMERVFSGVKYVRQNYAHRCRTAALLHEFCDKISDLKAPALALDVGCGVGNVTQMLRQYSPIKEVYGIDFSADMITFAQEHITPFDDKIKFSQCNVENLDDYPDEVIGRCDLITGFRPNSNSFGLFSFITEMNEKCFHEDPKSVKWLQLYECHLVAKYCTEDIRSAMSAVGKQGRQPPHFFQDIAQQNGLNVDLIEHHRFLLPFTTNEVRLLFEMFFKNILVQMPTDEQNILFEMACKIITARPTDEIIWMSHDATIMVLSLQN